jgi:predicted TIM-barrel fold metal-dependent hydrolase
LIIDGHAHACGYYHNAQSTINYLNEHQISKVILCPGEPNSLKNYKLPMFSNIIYSPNLGYIFNRLISFIVGIKGAAKYIDEQNTIIGNIAKQYPNKIIQAYWANPLDKGCIVKLEKDFEVFNFRIVKLHQCWHKFNVLSENLIKIIQWATNKKLPVFIHLFSKEQSIRFVKLTNEFINTIFIIAHMIGFEEITEKSINTNVYFDISAPQLISKKRIKNAIKIVGSNRLILGSDAPYGIDSIKINIDLLNKLSISEQEKQNIVGNNIARLLNLS